MYLELDALVEIHIVLPAILGLIRIGETSIKLDSLQIVLGSDAGSFCQKCLRFRHF